jgi:GntR family transcriptional repressor for pyruvate dehydrogenase complex
MMHSEHIQLASPINVAPMNLAPRIQQLADCEDVADHQPRLASGHPLQAFYQFRFVVEGYAAGLAATRVDERDTAKLRDILKIQEVAAREMDLVAAAQYDYDFHRLIMVYSGNSIFPNLYSNYYLAEDELLPAGRQVPDFGFISEHENIMRSIARRDPDEASYFMHLHIARAAGRAGVTLDEAL